MITNLIKKLIKMYARAIPKDLRYNFTIDFLSMSVYGISCGLLNPFFGLISRSELHASAFWIGVMSSAGAIAGLIAFFSTGIVPVNKELKFNGYTALIGRIAIMFLAFAGNAPVYCTLIFIATLFQCIGGPQYAIVIQRIYPIRYRASLMSYSRIAFAGFTLLFTVIGGFLIKAFGWRPIFFISGIFAIISTFVFLKYRVPHIDPNTISHENKSFKKYFSATFEILKRDKINTRLLISATFFAIGTVVVAILYPIYQADKLHMNTQQLSILTVIFNCVWLATFSFWGKYIDKKGPIKAYLIVSLLAISLPLNYFLATNWTMLIVGNMLQGAFQSGFELAWFNLIIKLSKDGEENKYQGMHAFWGGIRGLIGVFGGTFIISFVEKSTVDIKYIFLLGIVLIIISTFFLFDMLKHKNLKGNNK